MISYPVNDIFLVEETITKITWSIKLKKKKIFLDIHVNM